MSLQTAIFRFMCTCSDKKRDAGLTPPENIGFLDNIAYGPDKKYHLLDIYRPKNVSGKLPVIVNFHGGGWVYGTKETYRWYCMSLAEQGFAVVNPSYRLAPRYRFPAAFRDINGVFGFVLKHAGEYGFDTDRIIGIGDSAGATGMAVYAAVLTNPGLAARFPVKVPEKLKLCALGLNCGRYRAAGCAADYAVLLPKENPDEVLQMLHVPDHITPAYPPCHLMTAEGDSMKDEQQIMTEALERNGVRYTLKIYGNEQNPPGHVFHCNIREETAKQANRDQLGFFRRCLKSHEE